MTNPGDTTTLAPRATRLLWFLLGWGAVAIGAIGVVVPGLPTTGFLVFAAWCFSKSSPRFEKWLLELPVFGPFITDYRAGKGMPKRAKISALIMITVACTISAFIVDINLVRACIIGAGLIGLYWVAFRVPTQSDDGQRDDSPT